MAMMDNNEGTKWEEPSDSDKELTQFVVDLCDRWRDYRDTNF